VTAAQSQARIFDESSDAEWNPMIFDCSEIISDKLWIGSFVRPDDVELLQRIKISTVLCLQSDEDLDYYNIPSAKLIKRYASADIDFLRFAIPDFDIHALADMLPEAVEELEDALAPPGARVYVHCTAGINRSPTLAAAYLVKDSGLSASQACEFVMARRECRPYLAVVQEYAESLGQN
jgi:protein tyrosine phosphatase (PTP) superfamily phosphohydrolase (DUF442 family)